MKRASRSKWFLVTQVFQWRIAQVNVFHSVSLQSSGYDGNFHHVLHRLDVDFITSGLATHKIHFTTVREEVLFGKYKHDKKSNQQTILDTNGAQGMIKNTKRGENEEHDPSWGGWASVDVTLERASFLFVTNDPLKAESRHYITISCVLPSTRVANDSEYGAL